MVAGMNMLTRGIDTVAWGTWPSGPEPQETDFILLVRIKFNK
jgi:hypothetical protein